MGERRFRGWRSAVSERLDEGGKLKTNSDASFPSSSFRLVSSSVEGKKYFTSKKNYGIFVSISHLPTPQTRSRLNREMDASERADAFRFLGGSSQVRPEKVTVGDFPEEDFMDEDEEEI